MDDLITWLRGQLDAREAGRHEIHDEECSSLPDAVMGRRECDCGEPAFVLADIEAKRRLLELHELEVEKIAQAPFDPMTGERRPDEFVVTCDVCGWASDDPASACHTLRLLALPFAAHPAYDESWKP